MQIFAVLLDDKISYDIICNGIEKIYLHTQDNQYSLQQTFLLVNPKRQTSGIFNSWISSKILSALRQVPCASACIMYQFY